MKHQSANKCKQVQTITNNKLLMIAGK